MTCAYAYATGTQPQVGHALTRKDYVDAQCFNSRWDNRQVPAHTSGDANAHYNSSWDGAGVANAPSAEWHFFRELHHSNGANWRHQEAFNFYSDEEWFRRGQNSAGNYGPWRRRWHSGNFDPATKSDTGHTHSYLPLIGGTCTGAVTAPDFIISSDIKLKSGLVKIESALDKVCEITGYEYDKIVDPLNPSIKKREVGLIAQDVQKIEPSAVSELEFNTGDKYLGVSPTAIIALLIESVKDLKAQVDELKNNLIWSNK